MLALPKLPVELSILPLLETLSLESTLEDLPLYEFQIEAERTGVEVARAFDSNPLLPGAILTEQGQLLGMISRRRFLEYMSRPYGLELFLKRPIKCLYLLARADTFVLPSNTLIVNAARLSLQRPTNLLYEPIVAEIEPQVYKLLDVHQLMVAQSHIHELATKLLNEQTQAHAMQTEKMASLGQMMAGIAHEILNPVNFISGNVDYLSRYSEDLINLIAAYDQAIAIPPLEVTEIKQEIEYDYLQEDLPQIINSMKQGTDRLVKIINSMRNFSHMGEGSRKPTDLHECIESTLLILHNQIGGEIEVERYYDNLPPVECYPKSINQTFLCILTNAIEALNRSSNPRKVITLHTKWLVSSEIGDMGQVQITIQDNGPGITQEVQPRIFEPFFATKEVGQGRGLGLTVSYQTIVNQHHGRLEVRSEPGQGAEFAISIPVK